MSDPSDVPPEHLWITRLIARGMARADEEGTAFHRGGLPDATEADRTLHREYLEEAYEVLHQTGRRDDLALMELISRPPPDALTRESRLEEVAAWIGTREAKASRIEHQLHIWERGGFEGRDADWANRARKVLDFTQRQIKFGYKVRTHLIKDEMPGVTIRGLTARVEQLEASRDAERRKRLRQAHRANVEISAMRGFVREHAPELAEGMFAAVDQALNAFELRDTARQDGEVTEPDPTP